MNKRVVESEDLAQGGDACLCVEFGGATVSAAAWDAKKREAVELPVGSEGTLGCTSAISLNDPEGLTAWLGKPPKARAAEVHTSGCGLGATGLVEMPGLALGCRGADHAAEVAGAQAWRDAKPSVDADEEELPAALVPGSRVAVRCGESLALTPEEACALLMARPRQRATQLVARPVRRIVVVAPASASQAWRLAACEACSLIDARCVRVVSAPVALALRHRNALCSDDQTKAVVCCDCVRVPGSDAIVVDAVRLRLSRLGLCVDEVRRLETLDLAATLAELWSDQRDAVVIRGAADLELPGAIHADSRDAVLGAAQLRASELALPGAVAGLAATEVLPRAVAAARLDEQGLPGPADELFAANTPVPSSVRRTYERDAEGETLFAFLEDGHPCGAGMEDPFETVDDDGEVVFARAATVEYNIDKRGLCSAQVVHADAPKSKAREERDRAQRRCRRVAAAVAAAFFLTPIFYTLVHMRHRAVTRQRTIAAVEDFYRRADPEKVSKAASWADKYEGIEDILFRRLEHRYPGFKVRVPGEFPAVEEEESVAEEAEQAEAEEEEEPTTIEL